MKKLVSAHGSFEEGVEVARKGVPRVSKGKRKEEQKGGGNGIPLLWSGGAKCFTQPEASVRMLRAWRKIKRTLLKKGRRETERQVKCGRVFLTLFFLSPHIASSANLLVSISHDPQNSTTFPYAAGLFQ
jgi:hypothetical protein